jgi:hypothetical protein
MLTFTCVGTNNLFSRAAVASAQREQAGPRKKIEYRLSLDRFCRQKAVFLQEDGPLISFSVQQRT